MSAPLAVLRLPTPPQEYDYNYMARLNNTIELEKQASFFASSFQSQITENNSQTVSWFFG
tara:strand:+ start:1179 stop:1358 length:180 start_codon:yes stop_codon:yes gene_type:complete